MSTFRQHHSSYFTILTFIGIFCITLFSCDQPANIETSLNDNNSTVFSNAVYQIKYPKTWYIDRSGNMGSDFFLFSRLTNVNDNFKENISLLVQRLQEDNLTLDEYVVMSQKRIEDKIQDGYIISSEKKQSKNGDFQKVIYTGTQGNYKLKFEQNYWLVGGKAYILTFTSEVHQYKFYKKIGEAIMGSFEIL